MIAGLLALLLAGVVTSPQEAAFSSTRRALGLVTSRGSQAQQARAVVFDADTEEILARIQLPGTPLGCALTGDLRTGLVTAGSSPGKLYFLDPLADPPRLRPGAPVLDVGSTPIQLVLSPDDRFALVIDGFDGDIQVVDVEAQRVVDELDVPNTFFPCVRVRADGVVLAGNRQRRSVVALHLDETGDLSETGNVLGLGNVLPNNVHFMPGTPYAVVIGNSRELVSFDAERLQVVDVMQAPTLGGSDAGLSCAFEPGTETMYVRTWLTISAVGYEPETGAFGDVRWVSALPVTFGGQTGSSQYIGIHTTAGKVFTTVHNAAPAEIFVEIRDGSTGLVTGTIVDPLLGDPTTLVLRRQAPRLATMPTMPTVPPTPWSAR